MKKFLKDIYHILKRQWRYITSEENPDKKNEDMRFWTEEEKFGKGNRKTTS